MAAGDRTRWISNTSNDFNDSGNWSNGVPAVNAANDPDALFDGTGQADCTLNVSRGADQFTLTTTPEYGGNIGSVGVPLQWTPAALSKHTIRGTGGVYMEQNSGAAAFFTVDSTNGENALVLTGDMGVLLVKSGGVHITSTGDVQSNMGLYGIDAFVLQDVEAAAESTPDFVEVYNGHWTCSRTWGATTIGISGGLVEYLGGDFGAPRVYLNKGTVILNPIADLGAASTFEIGNAVLDASLSRYKITTAFFPVGPFATIKAPASGPLTVSVDLREEYP